MKRFFAVFVIFCACSCVFSGCQKKNAPLARVVTAVEISGQHPPLQFSRTYTQNEQMQTILQYLRSIRSHKKVTQMDEERISTGFLITVHLSDGADHIYALLGHRYFKAPGKPWVEIDGNKAAKLYQAIKENEAAIMKEQSVNQE